MSGRALHWGVLAATGLALFYVAVVGLASGPQHLAEQARADWYWLAAIITGFGVQLALLVELRSRQRAHLSAATAAAAGTGAGASAAGMFACCAHHLADLVPVLGVTGAAAFLLEYRIPMMALGIGVNAIGILIATRRVRRLADLTTAVRGVRCAA